MGETLYKEQYELRTMHCDVGSRLTLSNLFLLLQEAATEGSEQVGFGREFVTKEGIFWVISRIQLRVYEPPQRYQTIEVRTWPDVNIRYICPRNFHVVDASNGRTLLEAASYWVLVDAEKRDIVFPSQRGYVFPNAPEGVPKLPPPGKLNFDFPLDNTTTRRPLYSDFDVNGHMNNARYPMWIADLFALDFHSTHFIDEFQLNFVKEILWGDEVTLTYGLQEGRFAVRGTVQGDVRFEAAGHFTELSF